MEKKFFDKIIHGGNFVATYFTGFVEKVICVISVDSRVTDSCRFSEYGAKKRILFPKV